MTTITIRDVPETIARKLKARAERNRRSLQGELLVILEAAASARHSAEPEAQYFAQTAPAVVRTVETRPQAAPITIDDLWDRARKLNLPHRDESAGIVRKNRDERRGR